MRVIGSSSHFMQERSWSPLVVGGVNDVVTEWNYQSHEFANYRK